MVVNVSSMRSVSAGDRFREAAASKRYALVPAMDRARSAKRTFRELLQLLKLSGIKYLCLFLNPIVFFEPLLQLLRRW
jgi:hypothetical protein